MNSITFLGVSEHNGPSHHTSALLQLNHRNILIDCPHTNEMTLHTLDQGYSYYDIDSVIVTHLHQVYREGFIGLIKSHQITGTKPNLYIPYDLIDPLRAELNAYLLKGEDLSTFFTIIPIDPNQPILVEDRVFEWIPVRQTMSGSMYALHAHDSFIYYVDPEPDIDFYWYFEQHVDDVVWIFTSVNLRDIHEEINRTIYQELCDCSDPVLRKLVGVDWYNHRYEVSKEPPKNPRFKFAQKTYAYRLP